MAKNVNFNIVLSVNGKDVVVNCKKGIDDLGRALGTIPGKVQESRNAMMSLSVATGIIQSSYNGFQQISTVLNDYIQKSNAAAESQTKLTTIMRQRMSANDSDVKSINDLIAAQTKEGVVSGTVQRSGMQQLATFVNHKEALSTLLPAMNNLLVQQKGLNATSEDAVGIGNLMGKVLQGQTSALKRVGITFTDAEESTLKYGTEQQKAATLAQVITNNVGRMNHEMAQTDAGKMKKAANEIGSLQVRIGQFVSQYQSAIMIVGQVGMAVSGIASITNGMRALLNATGLTSLALKTFQATETMLATTGRIVTAAFSGAAISATQLRYAIKGTILSLGLAGVAYMAISSAVSYLVGKIDDFSEATDEANSKLTTTERLNNAVKEANDSVSSSVSEEKNRIKALSGIIESNTSTLADKKVAIQQLKSIIPGFNATIDSEGQAHINATNAIQDHITALDELQRAIAAYKVGQDVQDALAKASREYTSAEQKVLRKQNNVDAVRREMDRHHDTYFTTQPIVNGFGSTQYVEVPTQKGLEKMNELRTQEGARSSAWTDFGKAGEVLRARQQDAYDLGAWQRSYVTAGATTQKDKRRRLSIFNKVQLHGGEYNPTYRDVFGTDPNQLSPEESGVGGKSQYVSQMQLGEVEDEIKKTKAQLSNRSLSKEKSDELGSYMKTLLGREKELKQAYGMGSTPKGHTSHNTFTSEIQKIDDQLKKLKDQYVTASDDARPGLSAKIQGLEAKKSQINLEYLKSEVPEKITTSTDADKQLSYLEALRDVSKKDAIPAIDELIYKTQLFKLSLNRPEKFETLTDFDNEIAYEQKLLERASKEDVKDINAYIDKLESVRGAMKEGYDVGSAADLQASISRKQQAAGRTGDDGERARLQEEIKQLRRELALKTDYESGSAADLQAQIQDVDSQLNNKKLDVEARVELNQKKGDLQAQLNEITGGKVTIPAAVEPSVVTPGSTADKERSYNNANSQAQRLQTLVDIKAVGIDDAQRQIDKLNEKLKELGLKPIEIHIETDAGKAKKELQENYGGSIAQTAQQFAALGKEMNASKDAGTNTAAMMSALGQSLQQIGGDGEVAKVGATMAAIGQIILGFALAQRQAAEIGGAWGWLAFLGAGLAAVATTIATINSYATGGIVPGTSYTGDKVVAHVNSGEMILNAQQQARLFALANGALSLGDIAMQSPMQMYNVSLNTADVRGGGMIPKGQVEFKVKGRSLVGVLDADSKIGKKSGRRTVTIG